MTRPLPSRRSLFAVVALLAAPAPVLALGSDPILAAIKTAREADEAVRASARISMAAAARGERLSDEWKAHRRNLQGARHRARVALDGITPTTPAGLRALVSYHADRVALSQDPSATAAALRPS